MITQYEAPSIIRKEIPSLSWIIHPGRASMEVYASIQDLTDCARQSVEEHDLILARQCFDLADRLYQQGDNIVRMLIENIFVFAFSTFIPQEKVEHILIRAAIPENLYSIYLKQVQESGC